MGWREMHTKAVSAARGLDRWLPDIARLVFACVLLLYFWRSAWTKLGEGVSGWWTPSAGAYAQIFPRAFEAAGYDAAQMSVFHTAVALAGTWGELVLPLLIVLGLWTRLAALGMLVFVAVQSWVDVVGHGGGAQVLGGWFDGDSAALVADQRALWVVLLLVLVARGGGVCAVDGVWARWRPVRP